MAVATVAAIVAGLLALTAPGGPAGAQAAGVRYRDAVFTDVSVTEAIAYGAAPDEDGNQQTLLLDLYQPTGDTATNRPTMILAHGGGFAEGSRLHSLRRH